MVIHGSKRMYVEDKSVNNHPKQTVNHHGLDKGSAPTPAPTLKIPASRGHPLWWPTCLGLEMGVCSMICT